MNDCPGPRPTRTLLALLCLVLLGPAMIGRSDARAQGAADTQLEIEIQRGAGLPVERYLLACNPPTGTVKDPIVVDAMPKSVFDDAALKAIARWRYNPKVENGVAVERVGVQTRIVFQLEQ